MRIVGLFILVVVLWCFLSWPATEPETFLTDSPRDVLVLNLSKDILGFIEAGKFSEEDQKTVRLVSFSLMSDLPLKTIEEIKNDDVREREQPGTTGKEFKEYSKKRMTEALVLMNVTNGRLPMVSPDLAYDLERLDFLKEILGNANLKSEALDALLECVIIRLFTQTEA